MEKKDYRLKLRSLTETGEFEGYASVYGVVDSYGDIVEPGAFTKTLSDNGGTVPVLYQHVDPIGRGSLEDSREGLLIKGRMILSVPEARKAYDLAREDVLKGLSIGYTVVKDAWDATRRVRRLLEVKLYEVSLVTFPANPVAGITAIKSDLVQQLSAIQIEIKAGRTLSAATRQRISAAMESLKALLDEADADPEAAEKSIEPELLHSMIQAWQQARQ